MHVLAGINLISMLVRTNSFFCCSHICMLACLDSFLSSGLAAGKKHAELPQLKKHTSKRGNN